MEFLFELLFDLIGELFGVALDHSKTPNIIRTIFNTLFYLGASVFFIIVGVKIYEDYNFGLAMIMWGCSLLFFLAYLKRILYPYNEDLD